MRREHDLLVHVDVVSWRETLLAEKAMVKESGILRSSTERIEDGGFAYDMMSVARNNTFLGFQHNTQTSHSF